MKKKTRATLRLVGYEAVVLYLWVDGKDCLNMAPTARIAREQAKKFNGVYWGKYIASRHERKQKGAKKQCNK